MNCLIEEGDGHTGVALCRPSLSEVVLFRIDFKEKSEKATYAAKNKNYFITCMQWFHGTARHCA